jgi:DNA-binding NarL/FixJ family response regulator
MANLLRVALVDFDQAVRAGRRMVLDSAKNLEVIIESAGSDIEPLKQALLDVVVIDQRLATGSGLDFYRLFRSEVSSLQDLPSAVLTMSFDQPGLRLEALEAGFEAVVSIEQGPEALIQAITTAGQQLPTIADLLSLLNQLESGSALDLELREKIQLLPKTKASLIGRLAKDLTEEASVANFSDSIEYLVPLCRILGTKTVTELVIRLYRNGLLDAS